MMYDTSVVPMHSNRRKFLVASGLTALAAARASGANDAVRVGAIGCGGRMRNLLDSADRAGGFELVAGSDVYEPRRDEIRERSGNAASTHLDYRELLDKKDVDAVFIAAPNHWHLRMASDAIAAGKDAYLEKPVTHTIEEGGTLTRVVRGSNRVLQCGMQQRSWVHFQSAVELIQAGNIGRITQVRTYWYQNYQGRPPKPIEVDLLDWKRWLGSAPEQPFDEEKFRNWRWFWNFGGGAMTDLFTHWIDVVHWAMKTNEPRVAQTMGDKYVFEKWDCPDTIQSAFRYPDFEVGYEGTMISSIDDGGLEFRGTKGTLKINRSGFGIYREGVRDQNTVLSEHSILDGTISHVQNFFECVRSRKEPNAPVETGVAAARAGHIGNLALRRGEKITWPLTQGETSARR
ncbi:MAG TPA: Gfo/Idh/MocA family oxidoreductase [Bryobacteraceae bacterium]|nr:Gfo/Idh/MocA family oxidoreductase [Bryobacteraceae bacterium]